MRVHRIIIAALLTMMLAAASSAPAEPRDVRLEVTESGGYILAGKPVALSDLRARLRELKSRGRQISLHITGGEKVKYEYLMPAVQIAQEEGLAKAGFITSSPTADDAPATPATK